MSKYLKVNGVRRSESLPHKALIVHFNHDPTPQQLAEFMAYALEFGTQEEVFAKIAIARAMK